MKKIAEVSWDLCLGDTLGSMALCAGPLGIRDLVKVCGPFAVKELFAGTLGCMEIWGSFVAPYICGPLAEGLGALGGGKRRAEVSWDLIPAGANLWWDP